MAFKKWNTNFRLEHSVRKTGLAIEMFRCSAKFSAETTEKVVYHLFSYWICQNLLEMVNDHYLK